MLQQWAKVILEWINDAALWQVAAVLFFCAWFLMFLLGAPMINWLRNKRWRKDIKTQAEAWQVREDTPETHQKKQGTPSMGGIGMIGVAVGTVISGLLAVECLMYLAQGTGAMPSLMDFLPWLLIIVTVAFHGLLGFIDDWSKASGRGGLRARAKLVGQIALEVGFLAVLIWSIRFAPSPDRWQIHKLLHSNPLLFCLTCGFLLLVFVLVCNAANLTDGIDGLAAGLAVQAGLAFVLLYHLYPLDENLGVPAITFWAALAGSCFGFLAYNHYPAKVFMGDTGSLAIGAALGGAAIMCQAVFLLPFIAFIYLVEAASVTVQVTYFKYTKRKYGEGRRIFKRTPLHHHFELSGWSEWRVVGTFWVVNLLTSALGLILWRMGILPRFP